MTFYSERDDAGRPVLQIAMPRLPRLYAPGGTMHAVARCNNREFCFAAPEDFEILLDHLGEMSRAYEIRLFGYSFRHLDDRDSRWTSQRAIGSAGFFRRHHPSGLRRGIISLPEQIQKVKK